MRAQIDFVRQRDGLAGAVEYAQRALQAYRNAARYRNPETTRRHFAHFPEYRSHFVVSIVEIRRFLREQEGKSHGN